MSGAGGGDERRDAGLRVPVVTDEAPPPAGSYSSAIVHGGLVYVSGQTPRLPSGERLLNAPFREQVEVALRNLAAVAAAAGTSLEHGLQVTVYLRDQSRAAEFDAVYREFVTEPMPARAIVQSDLTVGEVEISAILCLP